MSENNKSYRINTNVGSEYNGEVKLNVNLIQDYDTFDILSLKIDTVGLYKYHTSKYGCVVGRVLANGGVGVPNVKISAFIEADDIDLADPIFSYLYPYKTTRDKNSDNIRYNLLPDQQLDGCHQQVGTFPNKRLVLDDNNVIEVYDKYYKFTTTTNDSGDYMLFGVPVGNNIIHSDLDLSDIGFLSQKPRDLFYKGYGRTQFENASKFKKDTNLDNLTQIISQDSSIYVSPFWGDETENEGQIKITRNDIDVNYKFEPTCIFIGCIVSDEKSNAISKNCIPHERMGKMDRLTTGKGTIEMIRKTPSGNVESFSINGNDLIDGNGTWCYQIPMNLDYMATDEYGNLVPTDNYEKGLPTRACVRFRVSLADYESDYENAHLVKVLVPNNPNVKNNEIEYDYEFGSNTKEETYRNLFWNNVYTVKSYIPRFQKGNRQRNKNFTGFKAVNVNGANNPIPYNNMRINLTFLFVFQCLIFKSLILIVKTLNKLIAVLNLFTSDSGGGTNDKDKEGSGMVYITLDAGMCPTLDGNYIAPGAKNNNKNSIITHTYDNIIGKEFEVKIVSKSGKTEKETAISDDKQSADKKNSDLYSGATGQLATGYTNEDSGEVEQIKIYNQEDYFVKCVELNFAMEYEVIQFDFYNDWINGMLYIPRWFANVKRNKEGMYYCGETFKHYRNLVQQCAIPYDKNAILISNSPIGCSSTTNKQLCHKRYGRKKVKIFGKNNGGIVKAQKTSKGQYAYYLRPSEMVASKKKANLFSTDIILLGSVSDCNQFGIPKVKGYTSSSYRMPPPTAEIISDTQEPEYNNNSKFSDKCGQLYNEIKTKIEDLFDTIEYDTTLKKEYRQAALNNFNNLPSILETMSGMAKEERNKYIGLSVILPFYVPAAIAWGVYYNSVVDAIGSTRYSKILELIAKFNDPRNSCDQSYFNKVENPFDIFYNFEKQKVSDIQLDGDNPDEINYSEMAGIDWGYNPFKVTRDDDNNDDTTKISNQIAGHFLEIGCTFSLSNLKSCVNLQRICELGGEMSQSHYYEMGEDGSGNTSYTILSPSGIIGKREVIDYSIRSSFATLNSKRLGVEYDSKNGYQKYTFTPYSPVSFMGDLTNRNEITNLTTINNQHMTGTDVYGLIENQSLSYKYFRFGVNSEQDVVKKFLLSEMHPGDRKVYYYMPQYDNSFYFYFGLRDGNTAIDRLYNEYYAECTNETNEENVEE